MGGGLVRRVGTCFRGPMQSAEKDSITEGPRKHGTQRRQLTARDFRPNMWRCMKLEPPLHWVFCHNKPRARRLVNGTEATVTPSPEGLSSSSRQDPQAVRATTDAIVPREPHRGYSDLGSLAVFRPVEVAEASEMDAATPFLDGHPDDLERGANPRGSVHGHAGFVEETLPEMVAGQELHRLVHGPSAVAEDVAAGVDPAAAKAHATAGGELLDPGRLVCVCGRWLAGGMSADEGQ